MGILKFIGLYTRRDMNRLSGLYTESQVKELAEIKANIKIYKFASSLSLGDVLEKVKFRKRILTGMKKYPVFFKEEMEEFEGENKGK